MPGVDNIISSGVSGLASAYKLFDSVRKNKQAKNIERNTKRPVYNRPGEIDDVYNIAASEVDNTAMKDFATDQANQTFTAGVDAILKSGGKADFATIYNTYGNTLKSLSYALSKERDAKIAAFNNAAYNKAKAKDTEFQYNKDAPYKDAMQKAAALRGQGEQSKNEAISLLGAGVSNYLIANARPGEYGVNDIPEATGANRVSMANPTIITPTPAPGNLSIPANSSLPYPASNQNSTSSDAGILTNDGRYIIGYDEYNDPIYSH